MAKSPREYNAHERHAGSKLRKSNSQRAAFLAAQATRLSSTSAVIKAKLLKYSAATIKAAASLTGIP
jgi:hypothetical protein